MAASALHLIAPLRLLEHRAAPGAALEMQPAGVVEEATALGGALGAMGEAGALDRLLDVTQPCFEPSVII